MRFLLEKSLEYLDTAAAKRADRNYSAARWNYLEAAEYLFQAAQKSDGRLREIRATRAEQLLDIARQLEGSSRAKRQGNAPEVVVEQGESSFLLREPPQVRFDDVAGLDEAKHQIQLRMILPLDYPEKAKRYGVRRGGGLLLYGPPGTGKTLLARAVAGETQAEFFTAKPSELMSKWVGESEQNVERIFREARRCERAVIFIDEVESVLPARRSSGSTVMQRVVPQILEELQGVRSGGGTLLFMGATNEPWALDPAALRPGRFDARVYVGLPNLEARRKLLELYLAQKPLAADVDLDRMAESLDGYSGADIADACERCAQRVFVESIRDGRDRDITWDDVFGVLSSLRPSVLPQDLNKYTRWNRGN